MCESCGCGDLGQGIRIYRPADINEKVEEIHYHTHDHENDEHIHDHAHSHEYSHSHTHEHSHIKESKIDIEQNILSANDKMAERNRGYFEAKDVLALNLVSSPGSGKTSLLEKTLQMLSSKVSCYVIEGDQQTDNDAQRIKKTGVPVVQINTGNACHLDANMIHSAIHGLNITNKSILFIENVGNLVCPSLFDLGESFRVVVFSVTEGEDKPLKYPNMFYTSQIVILNKIDLLPYIDFDRNKAIENIFRINPKAKVFELSVRTGEGIDKWIDWLQESVVK